MQILSNNINPFYSSNNTAKYPRQILMARRSYSPNLHVDFLDVIDSLGILKTAEYSDKEDQYMKDFFVFQYFNLYLDIIRAISAHQAAGLFLLAYRHADREPPIFV